MNLEQIPVNKPRCPLHAYHRDGAMRVDGNYGAAKGYEPNSFGEWKDSPEKKEPPLKVHGDVYNYNEREYDDDYYSQPGALFRLSNSCYSEIPPVRWVTPNCSSSNATYAIATRQTLLTVRE